MKEKGGLKDLLKRNILSLTIFIILISMGGVFAGNVFVTDGYIDLDDDLNASGNIFSDTYAIKGSSTLLTNLLNDIVLYNSNQDEDIVFRFNDGGSTENFIVDASENELNLGTGNLKTTGNISTDNVNLTGYLKVEDSQSIFLGNGEDGRIRVVSDDLVVRQQTINKDIILRFNDGGVTTDFRIDGSDNELDLGSGKLTTTGDVSSGGLDVDNDTLYVDSANNRVGIGTTSPAQRFHTYGSSDNLLVIEGTRSDHFVGLRIKNNNLPREWGFEVHGSGRLDIHDATSDTRPMTFSVNGDVGIGTTGPSYPLEVNGNNSGVSIYSQGNVSATGYITRTSVFDKSQGSALALIKDADDLKTNDEIDHSKFYGYAGEFEVTDYSRPETREVCNGEECSDETYYPYTKIEEGVSLDAEIDLLRQAVYELKIELCSHDGSYAWC